jgi:tetratricopeptide (TPR) repeat protein
MNLPFAQRLLLAACLLAIEFPAASFARVQSSPVAVNTQNAAATATMDQERAQYEEALTANPSDLDAQAGEVAVSERMALQSRASGDRDESLRILIRAQRFAPENTRLLYDLGVLEEEMQLYRDSDKSIARALELGGTDPYLLYAAARVKLDLGQLEAAERWMLEYLKQRPEDASAHYALGRIYHQGTRSDEAEKEFRRSIALQPKQTESYFQLGEIELQRGDYAAAIESYSITLKGDPRHGGALVGTGIAEFRQKQFGAALESLRKAVAVEPNYQPGHYYLGLTLARLGQREESAKELAEATRLADVENKNARQQLHLLAPSEDAKPN